MLFINQKRKPISSKADFVECLVGAKYTNKITMAEN